VLLKSLPYRDPGRIVVLGHHTNGGESLDSTTPGNLLDWMKGATAFESIAGFAPTDRIVTWNGNAERIRGGLSIGSIFDVLGRDAADGRTLSVADDAPGAEPVIVLAAGMAQRIFGVRSAVGQSISKLGIRMALGASARSVTLLVLGRGMKPVAAGVAAGVAGALVLTRFMEALLFGVTPTDPATFAAVAMLLTGIAAVASYIPARRATTVDPIRLLRE
jgi:hypothetical protein